MLNADMRFHSFRHRASCQRDAALIHELMKIQTLHSKDWMEYHQEETRPMLAHKINIQRPRFPS
eukprot:scaffold1321_cov154-Skeletonema_menzelii.AAC.3